MALAIKDLPQPWTPSRKTPFGSGKPKARARSVKPARRWTSQRFRLSMPPTAAPMPVLSQNSRYGLRRMARRFSSTSSPTSSSEKPRPPMRMRAKRRFASSSERPRLPLTKRSKRSGGMERFCARSSTASRRESSSRSGRGRSRTTSSFSSSGGTGSVGPTRRTAWRRGPTVRAASRRRRTTRGSLKKGCRS